MSFQCCGSYPSWLARPGPRSTSGLSAFLLAAIGFLLVSIVPCGAAETGKDIATALVRAFVNAALEDEHWLRMKQPQIVRKWTKPIRIHLLTNPLRAGQAHAIYLEAVEEVRKLSGVEMAVTETPFETLLDGMLSGIFVSFPTTKEVFDLLMTLIYKERVADPEAPKSCGMWIVAAESGEIERARIVLPAFADEPTMSKCAYKAMWHVMGLINSGPIFSNTILVERNAVSTPTAVDRILLAALYDPLIAPGMDHEDLYRAAPRALRGAMGRQDVVRWRQGTSEPSAGPQ